jgi:hypothetical protein
MNVRLNRSLLVAIALPLVVVACKPKDDSEPMTLGEAVEALGEMGADAQAQAVAAGTIEITTSFTIGQAATQAAQEIKSFINSQLPCAEVTLANATLSVEYGALPGNCTYRGHTYSGTHTIHVAKNDTGDVLVEHTWASVSNGIVEVSGDATVTWSLDDPSRHVVHELAWTRLADGKSGTGTGDRLQKPLPEGLDVGLSEDGARSWTGDKGLWQLAIDGIEMRWQDPIPQAGYYVLVTPKGRSARLEFSRIDEDSIQAKLLAGEKTFTFVVNKAGAIEN